MICQSSPSSSKDNNQKAGPNGHERVPAVWLNKLPKCNLAKARELLSLGGCLYFHLDQDSTKQNPMWRVTVQDSGGQHWALIGVKFKQLRQLKSVQQVYQIARNLSVNHVTIPVDLLFESTA
jgi:hypothetical protein